MFQYIQVEIADRKNQTVPDTWGVSSDGHVSKDPATILDGGGLLPLGGSEVTGIFIFFLQTMKNGEILLISLSVKIDFGNTEVKNETGNISL